MAKQQTYRKGVLLAGHADMRHRPVTAAISSQMLPVYDKPMIHYPLSIFIPASFHVTMPNSTPQNTPRFEQLLRDSKPGVEHFFCGSTPTGRSVRSFCERGEICRYRPLRVAP